MFFFLLFMGAGMPVNFVLGLIGIGGLFFLAGGVPTLDSAALVAWSSMDSFTLTAIPLFILMGEVILRTGVSKDLFDAAVAWFGKLRGGLGIATIFASGVFAAVSGSSAAGSATMGILAAPEMERHNYKKRLVYGTLTAGGSLAILIPPSVILIIYASFTEQSVGKLFLAGFIPGFILSLLFVCMIAVWTRIDPSAAPTPDIRMGLVEKIRVSKGVLPFIFLMVLCLGSIYAGVATPTEAAGLGASGSIVLAIILRRFSWAILVDALLNTVKTTCMVMFLILGGLILSNLFLLQNLPNQVLDFTFSLGLPKWTVLILLYLIFLVAGCFIDGLTIMIITLPIVAPLMSNMGYSLIWFGIAIVILVELSQLTPPVGMNLYIIKNVTGARIEDVMMGSLPFVISIMICLIIITIFPAIALYLPEMLMP
jgi:tripartite ATP-independent transporter DctM subunit